jgi:hypothetical protein
VKSHSMRNFFILGLLMCFSLFSIAGTLLAQETPPSTEEPSVPSGAAEAQDGATEATEEAIARPITTPIPRPEASTVIEQDGFTLELYFEEIPQGGAGVLHLTGDGLVGASANWFDDVIEFFPIEDDGFYGLISVSIEQASRDYDLSIFAVLEDDSRVEIPATVPVGLGGFIRQTIEIPTERAYLVDSEVERTEFARLDAIFRNITPEVLWDSGEIDFEYPVNSAITSPFGAVRVLNGTLETRHTGWDLRAATGTPVMSMASGKVAFAGTMDVRGNVVIVDHGYGVFSTYCHFSVINVVRGQTITKGQILGMSGNTGRSNGPHLHWEVNINGQWIDSVDFMSMWMPG